MVLGTDEKLIIYYVVGLCKKWGLAIPSHAHTLGTYGELLAYDYYASKGHKVFPPCLHSRSMPNVSDLIVDGVRVEVKTARLTKTKFQKERYNISLIKNRTKDSLNFDKVFVVLLKDIESKPDFIEIPADRFIKRRAFAGTRESFLNLV